MAATRDDSVEPASSTGREWRAVAVLVLAALLLRGAVLALARDAKTWNDQITYVQRAKDLLEGKGYTGSYQPWVKHPGERQLARLPRQVGAYQAPGYPVFVALVCALSGEKPQVTAATGEEAAEFKLYEVRLWGVRIAQVLLGAATAWLVYLLGRGWFGHRAGLFAGWLFALDPTFVGFTHYYFTETLFVFLFTAAMLLVAGSRELPSTGKALLAGATFAAASYVKSSILYLLPLLAAWFLWRHRERARPALRAVAIAALAWVACVAPWTVRNWRVHGGLVVLDSSGAFNFWRGNSPWAYQRRRFGSDWNVSFDPPFAAYSMAPVSEAGGREFVASMVDRLGVDQPNDLQLSQAGNQAALEFIREEPVWFLQRGWYKLVDLWNPTSFVMRHVEKHGYGDLPAGLRVAIACTCVLSYLLVLALALPALWWLRRDQRGQLVLMLMLYYTAIHAVSFGLTRFRLPVMPFLMVLAGYAAVTLLERRRARGERGLA